MTVKINKPAINLREELASLRNQGGLPKEDKLYVGDFIQNGDFSNGTTGWNVGANAIVSINSSGQMVIDRNSEDSNHTVYQEIKTEKGKTYNIYFDLIDDGSVSNFKVAVRDVTSTGTLILHQDVHNANGTKIPQLLSFTAAGTSSWLSLAPTGTATNTAIIDNISVQEVGENLVTNGTFDYDGGWTKGTGWTISGGTASCDGSQTGTTNLDDVRTAPLNASVVTIQFTLSGNTAGSIQPRITGGTTVSGSYVSGNGVKIVTLADTGNNLRIRFTASSDFIGSIDNVILTEGTHQVIQSIPHGYDVKDVYIDGELAREGEAYDYQVKTDGINQWLKPTVEPTATTETVVIGVRK